MDYISNCKWRRLLIRVRCEQSFMMTKDSNATCDIRLQDAAVSINPNTTQLTSINVKYKSA